MYFGNIVDLVLDFFQVSVQVLICNMCMFNEVIMLNDFKCFSVRYYCKLVVMEGFGVFVWMLCVVFFVDNQN